MPQIENGTGPAVVERDGVIWVFPRDLKAQRTKVRTNDGAGHSSWGPSQAHRIIECAGSVDAQTGEPNPQTDAAEYGTTGHQGAAEWLAFGECPEWLKETNLSDMRAEVIRYVGFVWALIEDHKDPTGAKNDIWVFIEQRVSTATIRADSYGSLDLAIYSPKLGLLDIGDLKLGMNVVEAHENPQLALYGLGAVASGTTGHKAPQRMRMWIYQPRAQHPMGPARVWEPTLPEWTDFIARVKRGYEAASIPGAPRTPGKHCKYCRAAHKCPELRAESNALAQRAFAIPAKNTPPEKVKYDPAELGAFLTKASLVQGYIKDLFAFAEHELNLGKTVPGWKLVDKQGRRKWANGSELEVAATMEMIGISKDEMYAPRELLSPTQVEKALTDKEDYALIEHLISKESSGTTLAPEDDPRPAARPPALTAFAPLKPETVKTENQGADLF